jgi:DNA-binding transcriptional regulator GbsR (MarR family)
MARPSPTLPPPRTSAPTETGGLVLPGQRPAEVVAFEQQVVDFFVEAATLLGVPKSVAAIYGMVFASPEPLSFAEIESRLNISKGSVSQGLRVLRDMGALKEVSTATDRAELFTPDLELRKLVVRFLENRLQRQLAAGSDRLAALCQIVPHGRSAEAAELRGRLKSVQTWHKKARSLLPVARTFLALTKS